MGLDIFLDDDCGFFIFVFFFIIKQTVDFLVPDDPVDQNLFINCFLGVGSGRLWMKTDLELGWVNGFVVYLRIGKLMMVDCGLRVFLFELNHIEEWPDLFWHWQTVSLFPMVDHMNLSSRRPSSLDSTFFLLLLSITFLTFLL